MIKLSNQFKFEIVVASGALAFDGRGWPWEWPLRWMGILRPQEFDVIVAKTVTSKPREGNLRLRKFWTCVQWLGRDSVVNAVGLTNPGMASWISGYVTGNWPNRDKLAVSVQAETVEEAKDLSIYLKVLSFNDIQPPFVEVNLSCPNIHDSENRMLARDIVRCLSQEQPYPLVVKLSRDQCQSHELIGCLENYVEAFSAINTVPWKDVYPDRLSPIESYPHGRQGGVSGRDIHGMAVKSVFRLCELTDRPVIGGGGNFTVDDMEDFRQAGASAFSLGSVFIPYPGRPNRLVKQWRSRYLFDRTDEPGSIVT